MNESLEISYDAPTEMMRDGMKEAMREADGKVKSPLLDVRNYYTKEEELVQVEDKMEEATVQCQSQS